MEMNVQSPAAKYNIKGIVEINLNKKKGATFGSSRESSVEKTPLSYISSTLNVCTLSFSQDQGLTVDRF